MCGITGIYAFNEVGRFNMINLAIATEILASRGPDNQGIFHNHNVGLGHRRLSIIDTSPMAHQPMTDATNRYHLIFNGEIYNFEALRTQLQQQGVAFISHSDTEVLLHLLITQQEKCLPKLNGFFAFAFYDSRENTLLMARDRYGIKPLHIYQDEDKLLFASEVKSILAYGIPKQLNTQALAQYLQLNYLPGGLSMWQGIRKLLPGNYLKIAQGKISEHPYYNLNQTTGNQSFIQAKASLKTLLEQAVTDRLVSDVPLGAFLSGGVDSSIISALAARHLDTLNTYSIGYKDEPYFDETEHANRVARHIGANHTVFKLTNNDLLNHVYDVLDYLDEPFADSSALAVYILSKETRKAVTVALSGDGADELFAGYNKHRAIYKMLHQNWQTWMATGLSGLWSILPASRNNPATNVFRQLNRFATAAKLSPAERYWAWAAIADARYVSAIMANPPRQIDTAYNPFTLQNSTEQITDTLRADALLVLPGDMLTKVDLMSMANSLEVRVPFLDHRIVDFAFTLPDAFKINGHNRKYILKEAFAQDLPAGLFNRKKHGFEVPLLSWFKNELYELIHHDVLAQSFIKEQGVFNYPAIAHLKQQLQSTNPGDAPAKIWALIVFQWWWKKYFNPA